jgi:hypothetical protein
MSYLTNSSTLRNNNNSLTPPSTGTDPDGWRQWWLAKAKAAGSDWPSLIRFHLEIVDLLRGSS